MTLILSYWNNSVSVSKEWHYLNGTVQLLIALISLVLNIIMLFCIKRYLFYLITLQILIVLHHGHKLIVLFND